MNISALFEHKKVLFSLEIFPPKKDTSYNVIYNTLLKLRGLPVDFISVTYGAGGSEAQREKTVEIASLILATYHIEPVAHLTCVSSDRQEVLQTLAKLKESHVQNVLALRGDITPTMTVKTDFKYASDLTRFIKETDPYFNVLGGCYPECHPELSLKELLLPSCPLRCGYNTSSLRLRSALQYVLPLLQLHFQI